MWAKLVSVFLESIIGGIIKMWESAKRDAANIEKGANEVIKEQQKDEINKAVRAKEVSDEVRRLSDDDIDNSLRGPSKS